MNFDNKKLVYNSQKISLAWLPVFIKSMNENEHQL